MQSSEVNQTVEMNPQTTHSSITYHPVVAQLTKPLKVILVTDPLLHQCGKHVPGMDVQHNKGSEGHPVLLGELASYECHNVVNLFVVLLQVGI